MTRTPIMLPSIAVAMSGALWGLYWIPIRQLDAGGIPASWTSFITFGFVGLLSLAAFARQWSKTGRFPRSIILTGLLSGTSVVFYAVALGLTEVIKTVLLFYLTPIWSTILGKFLLGEKITAFRIVAVIFGLTGLAVILGIADGIPQLSNLGDLLALLSGMVWAYATVRIREDSNAAVWEQVCAFYIGGAIAALVFVVVPIQGLDKLPTFDAVIQSLFWLGIFTIAFLPSMFLVFWGAKLLSPARVGILLMTEIIFGVSSAAMLSGEPFGWNQVIGITLIFSAAVIDVSDRLFASRSVDSDTYRET